MLAAAAWLGACGPVAAEVKVPALAWGACPPAAKDRASTAAFLCAEAVVPMDYAAPDAGTFTLALIKHPANRSDEKIGTLFWNPGGPSDAGTDYLPAGIDRFPQALRDRFDIVSWDPRGMGGRSVPVVQCFDSAAAEATFQSQYAPGIATEPKAIAAEFAKRAAFNAACIAREGDLLRHVSTADNARDLDLLRQAVGEERISYYGTSYGTFLGATYINMFPDHVRAAVLDGGVAPAGWVGNAGEDLSLSTFVRIGSDLGAAATVDAVIAACGAASSESCAFSAGSPAATRRKWQDLLSRAARGTVSLEGESVDDGAILSYVMSNVYLVEPLPGFGRFPGYKAVGEMLEGLWQASEGKAPPPDEDTASDAQQPATAAAASGPYVTSAGRQLAVICGESPNPETAEANAAQAIASFHRAGLTPWPFGSACLGWTARAAAPYLGPWNNATAEPVLVIGSSYDPATAFGSSLRLAQELGNARFLPVIGFGHTVLFNPNHCAQAYVSAYLTELQTPPTGAICSDDHPPFRP